VPPHGRSPPAPAPAAPAAPNQAIDDLKRLVALHDSGQLSDAEFAAAKTRVVNDS
jgi:hypothetical protein